MTSSQPMPASSAAQPGFVPALLAQDEDIALGFECADPVLQIERWAAEDDEAFD